MSKTLLPLRRAVLHGASRVPSLGRPLAAARWQSTAIDDEQIGYMSESHQMLQQMCRDFADAQLKPIAGELDRDHRYPAEIIAQSTRHRIGSNCSRARPLQ